MSMDFSFGKGIKYLNKNQRPRAVYDAVIEKLEKEDLKAPTKTELYPLIRECLRLSEPQKISCQVNVKTSVDITTYLVWDDGMTARLDMDQEDADVHIGSEVLKAVAKKTQTKLNVFNRDIKRLENKCARLDVKYEVDTLPPQDRIFSLICDTVFFDWETPEKSWY